MGREGEAVKAATGAKFSAALLQRCYFNWSPKLGTKYNFIFEIGSCDSLLHATRGFYSEAPHGRHASLIPPLWSEERRKVLFSLI